MALPPSLAFAATSLSVAYRGSTELQSLEIHARTANARLDGAGADRMAQLLRNVARGAGGGAEFHPASGNATHASGPLRSGDTGAVGPEYRWVLTVSALSPAYIKNVVKRFALLGNVSNPVLSMRITGSLPLDTSPLSVSEAQVLPWLEDPRAWPAVWSAPPFEVVDHDIAGGVWLRLLFTDPTSVDTYRAFTSLLYSWCSEVAYHPPAEEGGDPGVMQVMPQLARNHTTLSARYREFRYLGGPARDLIINMLVRFHHEVCPVSRVELGFST